MLCTCVSNCGLENFAMFGLVVHGWVGSGGGGEKIDEKDAVNAGHH